MKKIIACLFIAGISLAALAEHHESPEATVRGLVDEFNSAYATNDADTYFSFYTPDATLYFYGARQDVAAYDEEWHAMIEAGGGVEKNDISDVRLQVLGDGRVVMERVYRWTLGETFLECPGGLKRDPAARRRLPRTLHGYSHSLD